MSTLSEYIKAVCERVAGHDEAVTRHTLRRWVDLAEELEAENKRLRHLLISSGTDPDLRPVELPENETNEFFTFTFEATPIVEGEPHKI